MNYAETNAGKVDLEASGAGRLWTFEAVEERLVEAMHLWWRSPDRERGWLTVRAYWPEIMRHGFFGDGDGEINHANAEAEPAPLPLTRAQVAEMEAAAELLGLAPERDRKLVAIVLTYHARDVKKVPWLRIWDRLGRGAPGPEGLRKRYTRAIAQIAAVLSGDAPGLRKSIGADGA